jgi:hypothetical protein
MGVLLASPCIIHFFIHSESSYTTSSVSIKEPAAYSSVLRGTGINYSHCCCESSKSDIGFRSRSMNNLATTTGMRGAPAPASEPELEGRDVEGRNGGHCLVPRKNCQCLCKSNPKTFQLPCNFKQRECQDRLLHPRNSRADRFRNSCRGDSVLILAACATVGGILRLQLNSHIVAKPASIADSPVSGPN